jgi:hypothetical protein
MNRCFRSVLLVALVTTLALAVGGYQGVTRAATGPTGQYDILIFPGASATDCGTWAVYSRNGVYQPGPSLYTEKMTDGNSNTVFARSSTGSIGTYNLWDSQGFMSQPQANPIHEHVVMDGVVIADIYADDPCLPPSQTYQFEGPYIPQGYILRSVICDTPLYDQPGGQPIAGTLITAGQTWYVNPTPVVAGGTSWTEVFASSYVDGFVPASCVAY